MKNTVYTIKTYEEIILLTIKPKKSLSYEPREPKKTIEIWKKKKWWYTELKMGEGWGKCGKCRGDNDKRMLKNRKNRGEQNKGKIQMGTRKIG